MITRRRLIGAAAAATTLAGAPSFARAAAKPTVRIGFLDSFSGVFADIAAYHKVGATLALEDANRRGKANYVLVYGDDTSKPAVGGTEAQRLVTQENVDVLFGGTSSGIGLALVPVADRLGIFNLSLGPFDTGITGEKAGKLTYRFGANSRMLMRPMANRLLALGKKWYFIQADYALGRDAYAQLSGVLKRAGGTESGHDILPLGTSDFSSVMTKVRNSDAEVLVLANSGLDAANAVKQLVPYGLNKKLHLAGINLEDFYYNAVPLDQVQGATFTVLWSPHASDASRRVAARIARSVSGPVSARHFYGYAALSQLIDRIEAAATTDAEKLADAFANHAFDGGKESRSFWRGCDHQLAQDVYAGSLVSSKTFARTKFMFDVIAEVPANESDGTCESPWAAAAKKSIGAATIGKRDGYAPKIV